MADSSQQRMMWANDAEIDEDLHEVDMNIAMGSYGQEGMYEDGELSNKCCPPSFVDEFEVQSRIDNVALAASMQQQIEQQAAFASIPDVVKRVRRHPHYFMFDGLMILPVHRSFPPSCRQQ